MGRGLRDLVHHRAPAQRDQLRSAERGLIGVEDDSNTVDVVVLATGSQAPAASAPSKGEGLAGEGRERLPLEENSAEAVNAVANLDDGRQRLHRAPPHDERMTNRLKSAVFAPYSASGKPARTFLGETRNSPRRAAEHTDDVHGHWSGSPHPSTIALMRVLRPIMTLLLLSSCTEPNPYLGICGNGVVEPDQDEECDDAAGNGDAAACSMSCQIATCGDGLVQTEIGEECDLGNQNSNNGACTLDCSFGFCGDGFVQPGEACDDGNANRWPADGEPGCSTFCAPLPYCGDGDVQAELKEECDDANDNDDDACSNACKATVCGDGESQGEEECDDGNDIDNDGCTNSCMYAVCGDGIVHEGQEDCDDANDNNGDDCLTACIAASCGDGVLHEGVEECDDGNTDDDDGCNSACARDRIVFVTDMFYGAEFGGLDKADDRCQSQAAIYDLPTPWRYKAWLSDSKSSPATRFVTRESRYVSTVGTVIADNWDDLTDGELTNPIIHTANGEINQPAIVWTGTTPSGEGAGDGFYCDDWTSDSEEFFTYYGGTSAVDGWWTQLPDSSNCGSIGYLMCFED